MSLCSKEAQHSDGLRIFLIGFSSLACPFESVSVCACVFAAVLFSVGRKKINSKTYNKNKPTIILNYDVIHFEMVTKKNQFRVCRALESCLCFESAYALKTPMATTKQ